MRYPALLMAEPDVPPEPLIERIRAFVRAHRRRLQLLAIAAFVVAVGVELGGAYPREVHVALPIGAHEGITEARIEYEQHGEAMRTIRIPVRSGELRDTVELSPGDYDVTVSLFQSDGGMRQLSGRLTAPADGVVRLSLEGS